MYIECLLRIRHSDVISISPFVRSKGNGSFPWERKPCSTMLGHPFWRLVFVSQRGSHCLVRSISNIKACAKVAYFHSFHNHQKQRKPPFNMRFSAVLPQFLLIALVVLVSSAQAGNGVCDTPDEKYCYWACQHDPGAPRPCTEACDC